MKSIRGIIFIFAMLLAAPAGVQAAMQATVKQVSGDVQMRANDSAGWKTVAVGLKLDENASIKTGAGATAVLVWNKDNVLKLTPLTTVRIEALQGGPGGMNKSNVSLSQGKVLAKAGKLTSGKAQFTVETPTAVAGVRGTAFEFGIDPAGGQNVVAVVEGTVAFESGGVEILVQEGFESMVIPGEAPVEPAPIPPARLEELKSDAAQLQEVSAQDPAGDQGASGSATDKDEEDEAVNLEDVDSAIDSTLDNQILDDVVDSANEILTCPEGGGCVQGIIEF